MTASVSLRRILQSCCAVASLLAISLGIVAQGYDPSLQYAQRGSHYEGLRSIPISGSVTLLSARMTVDSASLPSPAGAEWGSRARLRFYLPSAENVTVTVRQLRAGSTFYVLDRVTATWKPGSINEYTWPTDPVLRKLPSVRPNDLGAVVNLGAGKDTNHERVLPVVLFEEAVTGAPRYRFSFKTDGRAKVNAAVLAGTRRVFERPANWEEAGSPFTVVWPASGAAEGWYRLLLTGQFDDGANVDKEVEFYHRTGFGDSRRPLR